ncbi:MAG: hypothetical protein IJE43_06665 [Alphaproteobacteria bacterium]|nr:hypothetical protein [Alphaproteobacteria bacterium]
MELFKCKKQRTINALDLPFTAKVIDIKCFKEGWLIAFTDDNTAILLKDNRVVTTFKNYQSFMIASNNMAMVTLTDGSKQILSNDGYRIGGFDAGNKLFPNGWHCLKRCDSLSLYNSIGMLVGENLSMATVFPNGYYHMRINNSGNVKYAGVFNATGTRLLMTNTSHVEVYSNGWFVAGGILYDNNGDEFIGMKNGHMPKEWKIKFFAFIMPKRKQRLTRPKPHR